MIFLKDWKSYYERIKKKFKEAHRKAEQSMGKKQIEGNRTHKVTNSAKKSVTKSKVERDEEDHLEREKSERASGSVKATPKLKNKQHKKEH